jgi:hypothetical protein
MAAAQSAHLIYEKIFTMKDPFEMAVQITTIKQTITAKLFNLACVIKPGIFIMNCHMRDEDVFVRIIKQAKEWINFNPAEKHISNEELKELTNEEYEKYKKIVELVRGFLSCNYAIEINPFLECEVPRKRHKPIKLNERDVIAYLGCGSDLIFTKHPKNKFYMVDICHQYKYEGPNVVQITANIHDWPIPDDVTIILLQNLMITRNTLNKLKEKNKRIMFGCMSKYIPVGEKIACFHTRNYIDRFRGK